MDPWATTKFGSIKTGRPVAEGSSSSSSSSNISVAQGPHAEVGPEAPAAVIPQPLIATTPVVEGEAATVEPESVCEVPREQPEVAPGDDIRQQPSAFEELWKKGQAEVGSTVAELQAPEDPDQGSSPTAELSQFRSYMRPVHAEAQPQAPATQNPLPQETQEEIDPVRGGEVDREAAVQKFNEELEHEGGITVVMEVEGTDAAVEYRMDMQRDQGESGEVELGLQCLEDVVPSEAAEREPEYPHEGDKDGDLRGTEFFNDLCTAPGTWR